MYTTIFDTSSQLSNLYHHNETLYQGRSIDLKGKENIIA